MANGNDAYPKERVLMAFIGACRIFFFKKEVREGARASQWNWWTFPSSIAANGVRCSVPFWSLFSFSGNDKVPNPSLNLFRARDLEISPLLPRSYGCGARCVQDLGFLVLPLLLPLLFISRFLFQSGFRSQRSFLIWSVVGIEVFFWLGGSGLVEMLAWEFQEQGRVRRGSSSLLWWGIRLGGGDRWWMRSTRGRRGFTSIGTTITRSSGSSLSNLIWHLATLGMRRAVWGVSHLLSSQISLHPFLLSNPGSFIRFCYLVLDFHPFLPSNPWFFIRDATLVISNQDLIKKKKKSWSF